MHDYPLEGPATSGPSNAESLISEMNAMLADIESKLKPVLRNVESTSPAPEAKTRLEDQLHQLYFRLQLLSANIHI